MFKFIYYVYFIIILLICKLQGFPNTMSSLGGGGTVPPVRGDHEQVIRGTDRGDKKLVGGDFGLKKSNICKIRFCMSSTYFS